MRPSTSTQAQFRPISPSPPRNVILTGSSHGRDPDRRAPRRPPAHGVVEQGQGQPHRPGRLAQELEGRLDRRRVHPGRPELDGEGRQQPGVELAGGHDVTLLERRDHVGVRPADQCVDTPTTPTAPTDSNGSVRPVSPE